MSMEDTSTFESRKGLIRYKPEVVFNFVADIRNLERFIPENTVTDLVTDNNSCSFRVGMLGRVDVKIDEKIPCSKIVYSGNLLQSNNFTLNLFLDEKDPGNTQAYILINSVMNPMLRMMAAEPVKRFLETLVTEMENFTGWSDVRK